jgi:hypothetical protein
LKKRFKVLLLAQEYSLASQTQIVSALAALHNFIVIHNPGEIFQPDDEVGMDLDLDLEDSQSSHQAAVSREEQTRAALHRDSIAKAMWEKYVLRLARRRR